MKILFFDRDLLEARPLSRFRSIFSARDGIYSPLERIRRQHQGAELYYYHSHEADYERTIGAREGLLSLRQSFPDLKVDQAELARTCDLVIDSKDYSPFNALDRIGGQITADLALLEFTPAPPPAHLTIVGQGETEHSELYLHPSVEVLPGSVFDLRAGPIVIDADTSISPFSYLAGPLYIGRQCRIDDARIGDSILGDQVRVGGEIENSIFGDFTNKHHEGFVGHSVLGRWVNLGALSTTSDLKNNYGPVRLEIPSDFYPSLAAPRQVIDSGRIKFGSLIGDCVKTAIGTMINTGTVIDAGSNIFGGTPGKYRPPLSWGLEEALYEPERFLADCRKIFARRSETPDESVTTQVGHMATGRRAKQRNRRLPLGPNRKS